MRSSCVSTPRAGNDGARRRRQMRAVCAMMADVHSCKLLRRRRTGSEASSSFRSAALTHSSPVRPSDHTDTAVRTNECDTRLARLADARSSADSCVGRPCAVDGTARWLPVPGSRKPTRSPGPPPGLGRPASRPARPAATAGHPATARFSLRVKITGNPPGKGSPSRVTNTTAHANAGLGMLLANWRLLAT